MWKRKRFLCHWWNNDVRWNKRAVRRTVWLHRLSGRERQLKLFNFTISFRMRELCRFDSFLHDVVYFPRNSNLTQKGNILADGVLLSKIPAGKKSKVVTIDLGNSLFTELAEGRYQGEKKRKRDRKRSTKEGRNARWRS